MKVLEFSLLTFDKTQLFAALFTPESEPKGIICGLHGFGEHLARYEALAREFVGAGYAMIMADQRGHGRSEGVRGYTPSYDHLQKDLAQLLNEARTRFPGLPVFLYAHSTGANIALYHLLHHDPDVTGAIMSSPWLKLYDELTPMTVTALGVVGRVYPRYVHNMGDYEGGKLSRDPEIDDHYTEDPYTHGQMSYQLLTGVRSASDAIYENIGQLKRPMLLQHGSGDTLIAFDGSVRLAEIADPELVTFNVWPDYWHVLHDDLGKEAVIESMIDWLDTHLPAAA